MRITPEKPIDTLYLMELNEIAEFYDEDLDFALKQAISIHHTHLMTFKKSIKYKEDITK